MQARYLYHIFYGAGKRIQEHESLNILYDIHGITEIETFFLSNPSKGPCKKDSRTSIRQGELASK